MTNYYDSTKQKNALLETLIREYNKDPKEGKRNFILSYLHTCSVFLGDDPYLITVEIKGKHYFNVTTYIDEETYTSDMYEELNVDQVVNIVKEENKYNDYKIDYIQIDTEDKKSFIFTISEYETHTNPTGRYIRSQTWIDREYGTDYFEILPGCLIENLNNAKFFDIDSNYKMPEPTYKYIDLGLKPKELTVFAGRPWMGKTILAINTLLKEIDNKGRVLYITLDDTALGVAKKILAVRAEISLRHAKINKFVEDVYNRAKKALTKLDNIYISECCHYNINEIERVITDNQFSPTMIIIDNFQAIHYEYNYPKNKQEIADIANKLKTLACELNTKIVVTSKVSRNVDKRKDKRPKLNNLKGGITLGEIADKVFMIYRDSYYEIDHSSDMTLENMEIIDAKNNHTIKCCFENRLGIIEEGEVIEYVEVIGEEE